VPRLAPQLQGRLFGIGKKKTPPKRGFADCFP
jgi:hypothetical protein